LEIKIEWHDSLIISAMAVESGSVAAFDLAKLNDTEIFLKVRQQMLQLLYARLQENGLCPPNVQALMKMKHLLSGR